MSEDILQRFLSKRLFDVGGDDVRLGHLRSTTDALAGLLKAAPERVSAFTMVAIDPAIPPEEPILAEVGGILQGTWNSYQGAFADPVIPVVFRAIILSALEKIIGSEPLAAAVALTARNLLPYLASRDDSALWTTLLDSAGRRLELRARREWALPGATSLEQIALKLPAPDAVAVPVAPRDWLTKQFAAASGPHGESGEAIDNANPNFPAGNDQWAYKFAPRAAAAVAGALDSVSKRLAQNVSTALDLEAQGEAIADYIGAVAAQVEQMSIGLERRNSLIWWKEALYSPIAEQSYRDLPLPVAAALMAIDASTQAGPFAPRMAEAFLLETLRVLDPVETASSRPLAELCHDAIQDDDAAPVREQFGKLHREAGRTSLASLIGSGVAIDGSVIERRVGLSRDTALTPAEFALWLYRELQASGATPPPAKRKRK